MILRRWKTQKPVVEMLQQHLQHHRLPTPVISCVNSEGRAVRELVATLRILARNTQSIVAFRDAGDQGCWKTRSNHGAISQLVLGFQLLNRWRMFDLKRRSHIYIYAGKDERESAAALSKRTLGAADENTLIDSAGQDLLNQQVHVETYDVGDCKGCGPQTANFLYSSSQVNISHGASNI